MKDQVIAPTGIASTAKVGGTDHSKEARIRELEKRLDSLQTKLVLRVEELEAQIHETEAELQKLLQS